MYKSYLRKGLALTGIIILGLVTVFVSGVQAQGNPRLWIDPATSNPVNIGDTAVVTMTASDVVGFNGIDIGLSYDPAVVEVVLNGNDKPVTPGECVPSGGFFVLNQISGSGQIDYAGTLLGGSAPEYCSNGASQDTTIGSVTFSCLVDDGSTTTVSYVNPILALVGTDVTPADIETATITCGVAPCNDISSANPQVAIAASGLNVDLSWSAVPDATSYEVWQSTSPYFTPGATCDGNPNCTVETGLTHTDASAIGNPTTNHFYKMIAANSCSNSFASNHVAEFDFAIVPGI